MKTFCIASIATILAIILGLYMASIALFLGICFVGFVIAIIVKIPKKYIVIFLLTLIAFYSYTTFLENSYQTRYQAYGEKEVKITAIIISNPQVKEYKDIYQIKVTKIQDLETGKVVKENFNILWNKKKTKNSTKQFAYGDKIEILATYEVPSSSRNEGGFDYRQYLKTKKVAGSVTTKEETVTKVAENQAGFFSTHIHNLKNSLIEKVKDRLPEQTAGVCIGLLLGDKSDISEEVQESFRQSSLSHMLAISGAHVSYLLLGITTFLSGIKLHKRWSKLLIILFLIFFMALVGFTPSVTRSCIMCILTLFADITFCKSNGLQNLAISSMIILMINPYSLLDIGFQLSFGGTIGIMLLMNQESKKIDEEKERENTPKELERRERKEKNIELDDKNIEIEKENKNSRQNLESVWIVLEEIKNWVVPILKVSICANLIIFPIMLYHFNTVSATFLISNLVATPLLGICLILGLIFIMLLILCQPIAKMISYMLNPLLQLLIGAANFSSKLPFSQILLPTPKIWQIVLYYLLLFLFFYKSTISKKKVSNITSENKFIEKLIFKNKLGSKKFQNLILKKVKIIAICIILVILFPYFWRFIPSNHLTIYCIDVRSRG